MMKGGGGIKPGMTGAAGVLGSSVPWLTYANIGIMVTFTAVQLIYFIADKGKDSGGKGNGGGSSSNSSSDRSSRPILLSNTISIDYEGDRRRREMQERIMWENIRRNEEEERIQRQNELVGKFVCGIVVVGIISLFYFKVSPISLISSVISVFWQNLTLLLGLWFLRNTIVYHNIGDKNSAVGSGVLSMLFLVYYFWPVNSSSHSILFIPFMIVGNIFYMCWQNLTLLFGLLFLRNAVVYHNKGDKDSKLVCGILTVILLTIYFWPATSSLQSPLESGFDFDEYKDYDATAQQSKLSKDEQQALMKSKYYSQNPNPKNRKNLQYMSRDGFKDLITEFRERRDKDNKDDKKEEEEENKNSTSLLSIPLPKEFNYTAAIELNNLEQGLYHILARHFSDWRPFLHLSNIPPAFSNAFDIIENQRNPRTARQAMDFHRNLLTNLRISNVYYEIHNAQFEIYNYIRNTVVFENYMGERLNNQNQLQVYFRILGTEKAMVIAMSNELEMHDAQLNPLDARPYRRIITIFFKTVRDGSNLLTKMFDKDGFKNL